jgi:hypothetical protein
VKIGDFLKNYAKRLAFAFALAAFLLFIPAALTSYAGLRVFLIVLIVLLLLSGGALVFYGNRRHAGRVHFFLYDRRRSRYYQREELTPEIVGDAMAYYLQPFSAQELDLLKRIPKPLRLQLDGEEQFRPLVTYRMLALLAMRDPQDALAIFGAADEQSVIYLCRAIGDCGDSEMADYIYHLKKNFETEQERIALFFQKNKRTFAARTMRYVERHFDEFYVARSRVGK